MKKVLERLLESRDINKTCVETLSEYTNSIKIDALGNIRAAFGGEPKILLDAHIDRVGLVVSEILSEQLFRTAPIGGLDPCTLPAGAFTVHAAAGDLPAVCIADAPHLKADSEGKLKLEELVFCADTISIKSGDRVSFRARAEWLSESIIAPALDDIVGVAVVFSALERLPAEKRAGVEVVLSQQEELGTRGARAAALKSAAETAIAVDVSFGDAPSVPSRKCGKMGGGVMIGVSPALNKALSDEFITLAVEKNIPHQLEVMHGETGTNADEYCVPARRLGLLSVPVRNMHTQSELAQIADCEAAAELLTEYILGVI